MDKFFRNILQRLLKVVAMDAAPATSQTMDEDQGQGEEEEGEKGAGSSSGSRPKRSAEEHAQHKKRVQQLSDGLLLCSALLFVFLDRGERRWWPSWWRWRARRKF